MTPLLGAKSPSAPVGDAPAGDGRAARSLLSCAWWRGIGRLWRGMGGRRPQRRQHGLYAFHETRDTKHGFDGRSGRHGSGRVASRKTAARSLLSCALWRGMGRLWRGMGGMGCPEPLSAHHQHQQQGLSGFHETRDTRHETRPFFETRLLPPCGSTWVRNVRTTNSRYPDRCSCHAITVFHVHFCSPLFTIVRYCSLLFAIVH